jgi:hypothetical protein
VVGLRDATDTSNFALENHAVAQTSSESVGMPQARFVSARQILGFDESGAASTAHTFRNTGVGTSCAVAFVEKGSIEKNELRQLDAAGELQYGAERIVVAHRLHGVCG